MAFFCAVEPWAVRVPVAQSPAAERRSRLPGAALLSEPHAASASVAVNAMPAMMPCRLSFTCCPFEGLGSQAGGSGSSHRAGAGELTG